LQIRNATVRTNPGECANAADDEKNIETNKPPTVVNLFAEELRLPTRHRSE
jgi:hypothetical protein